MTTLIPIILELLMKLVMYFFSKSGEKEIAEQELMTFFKRLDKVSEKASDMRGGYADARERLRANAKAQKDDVAKPQPPKPIS